MADKLQITIEAIDKATAELKRVRESIAGVGKDTDETTSVLDRAFGSFGNQLLAVTASIFTAQAAFRGLSTAFRTGIQEIAEREAAEIKLAVALRNTGKGSLEALNASRQLADEMARTSGVSDELNIEVQAILASYGKLSGETLTRATKAVFDLSQVKGDATSNAFALAKAASGVSDNVGKLGLKMDETGTTAQRFSSLLKNIEDDFGGLTEAIGQSVQGSLARFNESLQSIAASFTKITVTSILNQFAGMASGVGGLSLSFEDWTQAMAGAAAKLEEILSVTPDSSLPERLLAGAPAVDPLLDAWNEKLKGIRETIETIDVGPSDTFFFDVNPLVDFVALEPQLGSMRTTTEEFVETLERLSGIAMPDVAKEAEALALGMDFVKASFDSGTISLEQFNASMRALEEAQFAAQLAELDEHQQLLADTTSNLASDFVRMGLAGELSLRNIAQALRAFVADLIAAIVRMAVFNALVSAFAGGGGAAAGALSFAGGHFGTAPSIPNIPPASPRLGPIGGAGLVFPQSFIGVSDGFLRDLNEAQARIARQYGVQVVTSEALA